MSQCSSLSRVVLFPLWPLLVIGGLFRRRPKTTLLLGAAILAAGCGGAWLWAASEERAARLALQEERYADAGRHADHVLLVWGRRPRAHLLAARVARLRRDYPRAESQLRETARLTGGATDDTQLEWLLLRAQSGEVDEVARGLLRLVDDDHPEYEAILEVLSAAYMRDFHLPAALSCLNRWLERNPDAVTALDRRGWVRQRMEARQAARQDYERAVELAPGRWQTRMRLLDLLIEDNDVEDALPHLEVLERTRADEPLVWMARGRLRYLRGDFPEAEEMFDRVLAASPADPKALLWRAKVALEMGENETAEGWARRSLDSDRYSAEAQYVLYRSLEGQPGRGAEAGAEKKRYEQLRVDVERLVYLMNKEYPKAPESAPLCAEIGSLMTRLGQQQLGLRWLELALEFDPACKPAHEALASYYEAAGDTKLAEEHRRAAAVLGK